MVDIKNQMIGEQSNLFLLDNYSVFLDRVTVIISSKGILVNC